MLQVATQAAGVHFRTVDDFGVAAGQGIGELTTSVVLYGEELRRRGQTITRWLIETTAQITHERSRSRRCGRRFGRHVHDRHRHRGGSGWGHRRRLRLAVA